MLTEHLVTVQSDWQPSLYRLILCLLRSLQ